MLRTTGNLLQERGSLSRFYPRLGMSQEPCPIPADDMEQQKLSIPARNSVRNSINCFFYCHTVQAHLPGAPAMQYRSLTCGRLRRAFHSLRPTGALVFEHRLLKTTFIGPQQPTVSIDHAFQLVVHHVRS